MSTQAKPRGRNLGVRLAAWAGLTAFILSIPLIAMQFTAEVNWTASDFAFAGAMIMGVGVAYELAAMTGNAAYRAAAGLALAAAFLTIWTTGAVGIIADEGHPGNLMFLGVLAIALAGSVVANSKAAGMARAMFVAAGAQALVALIATLYRMGEPVEVLGACGFFIVLWTLSGLLFRRAAQKPSSVA